MQGFHFVPWTAQYIIGSAIVAFILLRLLRKKVYSRVYRIFNLFGASIILWQVCIFFHRNTSIAVYSKIFFSWGLFFATFITPFILLMFLYLKNNKKYYLLFLLPALIIGLYIIIFQPFEMVWSGAQLGWSYKPHKFSFVVYMSTMIAYLCATLFVGLKLIIQSRGMARRKHSIMLLGVFLPITGIIISNFWLRSSPHIPPLGGIFATCVVLIIAYAIRLPEEPISSRDSLDALETSYLDFINKLKQVIPGQELGESSFKFWDYIEAMGMEDMVRVGAFDKLVFQSDNFKAERIKEVASNVLKVIENFEWADQLADELASLLIATYKKLQLESGHSAEEWFEKLNRDHGGFMFSTDIFAKLPDKLTPEIHPKLAEESYSVFIDNPEEAYIRLQKAAGYSIDCLCLTKYSPQKLRNKYQFDRVDIYWFSYKKTEQEKTVLPDDIPALKIFLKRNIENIAGLQLLIDCLDEIRLSHGGENTIKFISSLVETCRENQANLYIAGRLGNFTKDEVNLIQNI